MQKITLSTSETAELYELSAARYESVEDPEFLRYAGVYANDLPQRLRRQL